MTRTRTYTDICHDTITLNIFFGICHPFIQLRAVERTGHQPITELTWRNWLFRVYVTDNTMATIAQSMILGVWEETRAIAGLWFFQECVPIDLRMNFLTISFMLLHTKLSPVVQWTCEFGLWSRGLISSCLFLRNFAFLPVILPLWYTTIPRSHRLCCEFNTLCSRQ